MVSLSFLPLSYHLNRPRFCFLVSVSVFGEGFSMGFRINTVLEGCEFRRLRSGTKNDGSKWHSMRVEDYEGNSIDISIRNNAFLHDCESLEKGDFINLPVLIVAVDGKDGYNYVSLSDYPEPCPDLDLEA